MIRFIQNRLISGLAIGISAFLIPGVTVDGIWTMLIVALVLGLINATIGWVLRLITAPLNFITLGLVSGLISVGMIILTDALVDGFAIDSFFIVIVFAIVLALINSFLGKLKK